jgi:hypothetical protein
MANAVKTEPKRPYERPVLIVHGTVRDLTQKTGLAGHVDSVGTIGKHKTGLG